MYFSFYCFCTVHILCEFIVNFNFVYRLSLYLLVVVFRSSLFPPVRRRQSSSLSPILRSMTGCERLRSASYSLPATLSLCPRAMSIVWRITRRRRQPNSSMSFCIRWSRRRWRWPSKGKALVTTCESNLVNQEPNTNSLNKNTAFAMQQLVRN